MKFIICVLIAALLSWTAAKSFDTPVVYMSYSTREVTEVSEKIYDTYLKANGQETGIASYGQCVDLLVECFRERSISSLF